MVRRPAACAVTIIPGDAREPDAQPSAAAPLYSFVIPIFREEGSLEELVTRLTGLLDTLDGPAEVILVDDGSEDASYALASAAARRDPRIKAVQLSRNFGHQIALSAGLDLAAGDAIITMDADLQHPIEVIPEMIERWKDGYDVVYGVMRSRVSESWLKRVTSDSFYRLLARLVEVDMPRNAGDFRLIDRSVLEALHSMPERNRYLRGMFAWMGFRQVGVEYDCAPRFAGRSSYTFRRMIRLGFNAIIGFSVLPLRFVLGFGVVAAAAAMLLGVATLATKVLGLYTVPGWTTVVVTTTFLGGIQLMVIGLMGEYVGRIYDEVKQRPLYLVSRTEGLAQRSRSLTNAPTRRGHPAYALTPARLSPPEDRSVTARHYDAAQGGAPTTS